jgi:hypothetical protein
MSDASAAPTSTGAQVGISAAVASDGGDLTADAKVLAASDLLGTTSDGAIDLGASAQLASFSLGDLGLCDGGGDGAMLPDTGVQIALAADTSSMDAAPADFGLLGGDLLNVSALDVPSLDLCSLSHQI